MPFAVAIYLLIRMHVFYSDMLFGSMGLPSLPSGVGEMTWPGWCGIDGCGAWSGMGIGATTGFSSRLVMPSFASKVLRSVGVDTAPGSSGLMIFLCDGMPSSLSGPLAEEASAAGAEGGGGVIAAAGGWLGDGIAAGAGAGGVGMATSAATGTAGVGGGVGMVGAAGGADIAGGSDGEGAGALSGAAAGAGGVTMAASVTDAAGFSASA